MRAAVYQGPRDVQIVELPEPEHGDKAVVRIKAAGICAADAGFYTGKFAYANYPRIGGHELVGVVEYAPQGAHIQAGERVVVNPLSACGKCYPCRHGKPNCCTSIAVLGVQADGGYAEKIAVPAEKLVSIGDLPFEQAVLIEPYTIGYHAVERAGAVAGENVLVMGAGAIGLAIVDQALRAGAAAVAAADMYPERLEAARAMGAEGVNVAEMDIRVFANARTAGEGFGVVFDATGNSRATESCFNIVAPGGTVVIIGLGKDKVSIDGVDFTRREMNILGSRNSVNAFEPVTAMMREGGLHPELLLTHRFAFENIADALERVTGDLRGVIKAALFFTREGL